MTEQSVQACLVGTNYTHLESKEKIVRERMNIDSDHIIVEIKRFQQINTSR